MSGGAFSIQTQQTLEVDHHDFELKSKNINIKVFDTAGMEKFQSVSTGFVRQADVVIIVYAIDDASSIQAVPRWTYFAVENKPEAKLILVGNKCDLTAVDQV